MIENEPPNNDQDCKNLSFESQNRENDAFIEQKSTDDGFTQGKTSIFEEANPVVHELLLQEIDQLTKENEEKTEKILLYESELERLMNSSKQTTVRHLLSYFLHLPMILYCYAKLGRS